MKQNPLDDFKKSADFLAAVMLAANNLEPDKITMIDCPCGGKIKIFYSESGKHRTIVAKCNSCKNQANGKLL